MRGKGKTYTFYDREGESFPFYAKDEKTAIRYALDWARRTGRKLYRAKKGTSPTIRQSR